MQSEIYVELEPTKQLTISKIYAYENSSSSTQDSSVPLEGPSVTTNQT
jgi:hypothetical protein